MSGLTFGRWSIEGGALLRWDLSGPKGLVRFEVADALGFTSAAVYLHEYVAPKGGELEDCPVCGKCWCNALPGIGASLRAEWEAAGDDEIIREALERWYNEELSTPPVPVSEWSQVSGEVGPGGNGPNLAATGAGTGLGGVVPVPVVAQPEPDDKQFVLFDHHLDMDVWYRDDAVATEARASSGSHDDERWFKVGDYDGDPLCWENVLGANPDVVPVLLVRGPLVDHNLETLRTQREMDADLYENWVANQEAGTGSADPDGGQR